MKKRILVGLMAMMMLVSSMVPTVAAASQVAVEEPEKQLYSTTVDLADLMATGSSSYKTVNLGLVLDAGASGWSNPVYAKFSTLPTNAVVESVEIKPGTVTINSGNPNFLGVVNVTRLRITAPSGQLKELTFNKSGMETMSFYGEQARGNWMLMMYGQNLTYPTGDMFDSLRMGSVQYKSAKVTIYYTLE